MANVIALRDTVELLVMGGLTLGEVEVKLRPHHSLSEEDHAALMLYAWSLKQREHHFYPYFGNLYEEVDG